VAPKRPEGNDELTSKAGLSSILALFIVLATAACGTSTTTSEPTATTTAVPTSAEATTPPAQPAAKVSANTASETDIEGALAAAGVTNPARWAAEVVEYRPYPADDLNLTKLRHNLAKYNPGQETVDKIVSALTP
jgi:ABC-type Fe3+-hydroxamate transport system substrate-binding protein